MRRREPPPIAVWVLEHMTSGDRDEAIPGDLLETFQSGRSNAWYWREALAACVVSWSESLRRRASLLVFAFLWSTLAPGWNAVCSLVLNDSVENRFCYLFGAVWILPAFITWAVLHSVFLWAGLLVFGAFHSHLAASLHAGRYKRAFLLAPVVFVPAYGLLFFAVSLYWFSTFERYQLATSPLSQVMDFRVLADAVRIPYLLALLWPLWSAVVKTARAGDASSDSPSMTPAAHPAALAPSSPSDPTSLRRFFTLMVGAGLMNAMIAGILLCRLPESHYPTLASLCLRAILYLLAGTLIGIAGTYLYWKNPASPFHAKEPLPFPLFALVCAAGWVWVPAGVILSEQLSPVFPFVAMIGALVLTAGLRRVSTALPASIPHGIRLLEPGRDHLFADSLNTGPAQVHGYMVALGVYAGAVAVFLRAYGAAALFLVLAASVLAWKNFVPRDQSFNRGQEYRRAALRLVMIAIPALLMTFWALLDGVARRNLVAAADTATPLSAGNSPASNAARRRAKDDPTALGAGGYESVILWPYPARKSVTPPIPTESTLLANGSKEPLVIPFNGPYWYLQPPNKVPGQMAHQAIGTPLSFDIQVNNAVPLMMDAHQYLSSPIPTARCREISLRIQNRDNTAGDISIGLLLTDGTARKTSTVYLGEQPIPSAEPAHFALKRTPVVETLHFHVPTPATARQFNEITVLIFPGVEHTYEAPKIAIQQFELTPR
jgi:hypothetical protein